MPASQNPASQSQPSQSQPANSVSQTSQPNQPANPASQPSQPTRSAKPASQTSQQTQPAMTTATSTTTKQIFEYDGDIVSADLSNVRFCPGPCNNTMEEPAPSIYMHCFKPYSGGKYARFCYPINNTQTLVLNNLRICASCHRRYLEFSEENCTEDLMSDAKIIMKKLEKNLV